MSVIETEAESVFHTVAIDKIVDRIGAGEGFGDVKDQLAELYNNAKVQYQRRDWMFVDYQLTRIKGLSYPIRGPVPDTLRPKSYFVVLGSATSFGARVQEPYAQLLSEAIGMPCINLSHAGASPEFFRKHHKSEIEFWMSNAAFAVFEVMSSRSVSNSRFTTLEGRGVAYDEKETGRPQVRTANALRKMARKGQMNAVQKLVTESLVNHRKFFARLARTATCPKVLLWLSRRSPDGFDRSAIRDMSKEEFLGHASVHPHFSDRKLVDAMRTNVDIYVECVTSAGLPMAGFNRFTGEQAAWDTSMGKNPEATQSYYPSSEMHREAFEELRKAIRWPAVA